jgi:excinuclease UvrABC ATPase subunit
MYNNLYLINHDGNPMYVLAPSYAEAVDRWLKYDQEIIDKYDEPEMVSLITTYDNIITPKEPNNSTDKESWVQQLLDFRQIESMCGSCMGSGIDKNKTLKLAGKPNICEKCWGSGDEKNVWPS